MLEHSQGESCLCSSPLWNTVKWLHTIYVSGKWNDCCKANCLELGTSFSCLLLLSMFFCSLSHLDDTLMEIFRSVSHYLRKKVFANKHAETFNHNWHSKIKSVERAECVPEWIQFMQWKKYQPPACLIKLNVILDLPLSWTH